MDEKKEFKKQIKTCKKGIKQSNYYVRGFIRSQSYQPGSYRKLQKTEIWNNAKSLLLQYHGLKYNKLICFKCGLEITNNPILHHKKYNWKKLFSPRYVGFVHRECHTAVHSIKRGYKRSLSYSQIKLIVVMIAVIVLLTIFGLTYLSNN